MDKSQKLCSCYVAMLRAAYIIHQNHHWVCKGPNFYGSHLLFERIYKDTQETADLAAEKFIGLYGTETLDFTMQIEFINKILNRYKDSNNPFEVSLRIEKEFLVYSKKIFELFEQHKEMTPGLNDTLSSIANKHEEIVYLLQQSLDTTNL